MLVLAVLRMALITKLLCWFYRFSRFLGSVDLDLKCLWAYDGCGSLNAGFLYSDQRDKEIRCMQVLSRVFKLIMT